MTAAVRHSALAATLLCAVLAWQPIFTVPAERFNAEVFGSALRIYAILRGINAAISVAKETEVGVQFVGSMTTQPGMVLDPIDETVARVSEAVFLLAAGSGVLAVALVPLAQIGALLAGTGFFALWLAQSRLFAFLPLSLAGRYRALQLGALLARLGLVLALALPLGYGVGGSLGTWWTSDTWEAAQTRLSGEAEDLVAAVEQAASPPPAAPDAGGTSGEDTSLLSRLMTGARQAGDAAGGAIRDAVPDLQGMQERGGEIVESSLTLIAIYLFRLLVLPAILLWVVLAFARRALPPYR